MAFKYIYTLRTVIYRSIEFIAFCLVLTLKVFGTYCPVLMARCRVLFMAFVIATYDILLHLIINYMPGALVILGQSCVLDCVALDP